MTLLDSRNNWHYPLLFAAPALLVLLFFFIGPLLYLARMSLYVGGGASGLGIGGILYKPGTWTLGAYAALFTDKYFWDVFIFTLLLGIGATLLTLLLAYPLALTIHGLSPRLKVLALLVVLLPKIANPLVVIYGLELVLSNTGPINSSLLALGFISEPIELFHNLIGVVVGEVYLGLPYAVLILVTAIDRIDQRLVAAASGLGASSWEAFWRVRFPLSLPGVSLATTITLIFALGAFTTSYLLGSPEQITLAVDVQKQTFENLNWPRGAAEAVVPLLITLVVLVVNLYDLPTRFKQSSRLKEEVV